MIDISQFRIGDRVVAVGTIDGKYLNGKYGTIVCFSKHINYVIGIEFDEKIPGGHTCANHGKNKHCWYARKEDTIELIAEDRDEFKDNDSSESLIDFLSEFKQERCFK